jgi:hypothetical protein
MSQSDRMVQAEPRRTRAKSKLLRLLLGVVSIAGCEFLTGCYVGGTVAGLTGSGLVLQESVPGSVTNLSISANGPFAFLSNLHSGQTYTVTVLAQPAGQACSVANGSGTMDSVNIRNVAVSCQPVPCSGLFQPPVNYPIEFFAPHIALGDVNGDGNLDMVVAGSGFAGVFMGAGGGAFQPVVSYSIPNSGDQSQNLVDGLTLFDGLSCVIVGDPRPATSCRFSPHNQSIAVGIGPHGGVHDTGLSYLLNQGNGTFVLAPFQQVDFCCYEGSKLADGDFNSDRIDDLVVTDNGQRVGVLLGNAGSTFQPPTYYPTASPSASVVVGDFNRDGNLDLAVAQENGGVSVLLGNGDGTFQDQKLIPAGSLSWGIAASDFNRDGKLDLAVTDLSSNIVSVLLGNGDGTFQPAVSYPTGTGPDSVAVGDFNGDGKLDLAVSNQNSVSILLGNGDGTFQNQIVYATGFFPKVAAGSFRLNGKTDLAVQNGQVVSVFLTCP